MMTEAFSLQLMARNRETKVYRNRGKSLAILLMAGAFFGACFIVFWNDVQAGKLGLPREILFWTCFATLGLGMLLGVARLFDSRPVLEFSEDGLIARDISNDVIPWTVIRAITARKIKTSTFIEVQIDSATIA
jgi:hypothetical protein